jgi:hypothetical protein
VRNRKDLTSLFIQEKLAAERTLVLVPSLSLLKQTMQVWAVNRKVPYEALPVCSDETVGQSEEDAAVAHTSELGVPVVVEAAGLQAVVELAEEFVEQVPLGLVVPVAGRAAGIEVSARSRRCAQRAECPDRADGGQALVFDVPMQHNGFLAAGAGDGRRPGVGLKTAGVGEADGVVPDLGEHPGAGQLPQTGEAGDDLCAGCRSKWSIAASVRASAARHAASSCPSSAVSWIPIAHTAWLPVGRRIVHSLCISRAIAACFR